MTFRDLLRSLPSMPSELPDFDAEAAPADPVDLFGQWLEAAKDAGQLLPHGATLSTADADGTVSARVLVLRDIDDAGWAFSTHASSPKGRAMAANPHAALTFFWPVQGRQVRVEGRVERASAEESKKDFQRRSEAARTALLVGRQSEPMKRAEDFDLVTLQTGVAVSCSPATLDRDWAVYRVVPERIEFWQGSTRAEQDHTRLLYSATDAAGTTEAGTTDAGTTEAGTTEAGGSPWERTRLWP